MEEITVPGVEYANAPEIRNSERAVRALLRPGNQRTNKYGLDVRPGT